MRAVHVKYQLTFLKSCNRSGSGIASDSHFPMQWRRPTKNCTSLKPQTNPSKFWPRPCRTSVMVLTGSVHRIFSRYILALGPEDVTQCIALQNKRSTSTKDISQFSSSLISHKFGQSQFFISVFYFPLFSSAEVEDILRRYPELGTELLAKMRRIRPVEKWVQMTSLATVFLQLCLSNFDWLTFLRRSFTWYRQVLISATRRLLVPRRMSGLHDLIPWALSSTMFIAIIHLKNAPCPLFFFEWEECWVPNVIGHSYSTYSLPLCSNYWIKPSPMQEIYYQVCWGQGTQVVSGGCGRHANINFKWKTADNRVVECSWFWFILFLQGMANWATNLKLLVS